VARRSSAVRQNDPSLSEVLHLPDGATATREGDVLALRDADGRLCVKFAHGTAEIVASAGDLILSSPAGRVVVKSAMDIELEAARDVTQRASRKISLEVGEESGSRVVIEPGQTRVVTKKLDVEAQKSRLVTGHATVVAQKISTTALRVAQSVDRWELSATRIVESAKDAFLEVTDLVQSRVGRVRTFVKGAYAVHARRATVVSQEETKVDGKKVLLG